MALCSNAVMQLCVMQCEAHLMSCIRPCLVFQTFNKEIKGRPAEITGVVLTQNAGKQTRTCQMKSNNGVQTHNYMENNLYGYQVDNHFHWSDTVRFFE